MGFTYMPLVVAAHYGVDGEARRQFIADVFDPPGLVEPAGQPAALASLNGMIATAESRWGNGRIRSSTPEIAMPALFSMKISKRR